MSSAPVEGLGEGVAAGRPEASSLWLGAVLMLAASVSFGVMGLLVKVAHQGLSTMGLVFGRSLVVVVLGLAWMRMRRLDFRIKRLRLLVWRCLAGSTAMVLYFLALGGLPLSTAITIQYLSPVFVALLSGLVVHEKVSRSTLGLVALAFGGTALVLSPELDAPRIEIAAAVISALLMAFAYLGVRSLRHHQSADSIVLYFAVFCTVGSVPWAPELFDLGATQLFAVLGVGVSAFVGQLLMTHAYRYAEAAFVSAFSYFTVIVGALLGVLLLGETLGPASGLGIALCVAAGVALSLQHRRTAPPSPAP